MKDIIVLDQFAFAAHAFHSVGLAMADMRDQQQIMSDNVKGIQPIGVLLMTLFLVNPSGPVQQVTLDKGVAPTNRGGLQRIPFLAVTPTATIEIYISLISQLNKGWTSQQTDVLRKTLRNEFITSGQERPATDALKAELKGPTGVVPTTVRKEGPTTTQKRPQVGEDTLREEPSNDTKDNS